MVNGTLVWTVPLIALIAARWGVLYSLAHRERSVRGATVRTGTINAVFCGVLVTLYFAMVVFQWTDYYYSRNAIAVLCFPMLAAALWWWPPIVIFDDWGITARYFVRATKRIPYSEIRNIVRKSDTEFAITGSGKVREINLSAAHGDASEIEKELRRRGAPWYKGEDPFMGRLIYDSPNDDRYSPP